MADITPIKFIDDNPLTELNKAVAKYQSITNRTLNEGDPEMPILSTIAYLTSLCRADVNYTGNQNLLRHSSGVALEELGYPFDVYRLEERGALVVMQYNLQAGHGGLLIDKGNRVKSENGKAIFQTTVDTNVAADETTVFIISECLETGIIGNDFIPGKINVILDPITNVLSAENYTTSTGGGDEEPDDELRERIQIASAKFSVAGPEDAYAYWAKSAHPLIVDVKVTSPAPIHINLYVLLDGGTLPDSTILAAVEAICSPKKTRPQTDVVVALAPTKIDYAISFKLILRKNANPATLQNAIDRVNAFVTERKNQLGLDVVREQIEGVIMEDRANIYKPILESPLADIVASADQYTNCTGVTGTVQSIADE